MKRILYLSVMLPALWAQACYEDKGNYDYITLPEFYVDTVGKSSDLRRTMLQFEELNITPALVFDGDASRLEHSWMIYPASSEVYVDLIGTPLPVSTPGLSMRMSYSTGTYFVQYTAYDPLSKRQVQMRWRVSVEGVLGKGWLVYYQRDGVADCDLIRTRLLTESLVEEKVLRNIYSAANPGRPITTRPVASDVLLMDRDYNWLTLLWEGGGGRFSLDDMSQTGDYASMFYDVPAVIKPQAYPARWIRSFDDYWGDLFVSQDCEVLVNDGAVYTNISWYGGTDQKYLGPLVTDDSSPYYASHVLLNDYNCRIVYDSENMRFLYNYIYSSVLNSINAPDYPFDFNDVGKKMMWIGAGFSPYYWTTSYALFRNPVDDGSRYIYVMHFDGNNDYDGLGIMDVSDAPGITEAELWECGERGPVMYYAGGRNIRQVKFDLDELEGDDSYIPDVVDAWTAPAGETITCMKFMKWTQEGWEYDYPPRTDDKYLFVATWNEAAAEGRVYVLESNISNGTLTQEPLEIHTGFGRIADMCYKVL